MVKEIVVAGVTMIVYASSPSFAFAGSYTVTTTPEQDAALAEMAKRPVRTVPGVNAPTATTPQALVQGFVDRALYGHVNQVKRAAACAKLTDAAQKQALGCPK